MHSESAQDVRRTVRIGTRIVRADGSSLGTCLMVDISGAGARLKLETSDPLPDQFILLLSHSGQLCRHCSVEWQSGTEVEVRFVRNSSIK